MLFLLTNKFHGIVLDCGKNEQNQYEIVTKYHRLLKVLVPVVSVVEGSKLVLLIL